MHLINITVAGEWMIAVIVALLAITSLLVIILLYLLVTKISDSKKMKQLAENNPVTNSPSNRKIKLDAKNFLSINKKYTSIFLDISDFKTLNQLLDYDVGTQVLKEISNTIMELKESYNLIFSHLAKDEFIIILEDEAHDFEKIKRKFERILFIRLSGLQTYKITFFYGVYYFKGNLCYNDIVQKTNYAHKKGKSEKQQVFYYEDKIKSRAIYEKQIEDSMIRGINNKQFKAYLQPQVCLNTDKLYGVEILVRWEHDSGFILPDDFITIFEKNGFIWNMDFYMYEKSLMFLKKLMNEKKASIKLSVNFSRYNFHKQNFVEHLTKLTEKYDISPKLITLEITESMAFDDECCALKKIKVLQNRGFTIAVDDFGSGFTSIKFLSRFHVDVVKLDKSLLDFSINKDKMILIVSAIVKICKQLGVKVVAEGVENAETEMLLKELGCDIGQGYYYSKPLNVTDFLEKYYS